MALTRDQSVRYKANLALPGVGEEGQERLLAARVCIVGLGGLGSPVAYYLASAGVGTIGLVDPDRVELSNLQRQIVHASDRVGQTKTASAAQALGAVNPDIELLPFEECLTQASGARLLADFDVVVEATDNFEAKFAVNDVCLALGKPFATAGVLAASGQAQFVVPGKTPCLRCAVPAAPEGMPTTADRGVLGPVAGLLGTVEAVETLRWLLGLWRPQEDGAGLLHSIDGDTVHLRTLRVARRMDCACAPLWSEK